MQVRRLDVGATVAAAFCLGLPSIAHSVGFTLEQQSASNAGYAFAGGVAGAEDASAMFWNAASLSRVPGRQFVVGAHAIYGSVRFSDQGTLSPAGAAFPITGGTGGNAVGLNWLANLYVATDISQNVKAGLGINSPFGLRTAYPHDWMGRYQAIDSVLHTININPALSWQVSPSFAIGGGPNFQYFDARISNAVDFGAACFGSPFGPAACAAAGILPQTKDGVAEVKGDSWGVGWNVGALLDVNPSLRAGIAYRSAIRHDIKGSATFSNPALPPPFSALTAAARDTGAQTTIKTPDSLSIGATLRIDPNLSLLGDATWTGWHKFNELRVRFDNGSPDAVTPANWRNSVRLSIGAGYKVNDRLKLRGGVAHEKSAIPDEFRTPRIPDNDHTIVAFGLNYKVSRAGSVDFAYHHGFVKNSPVNTSVPGAGTLVGAYKVSADVVSVQYNQGF